MLRGKKLEKIVPVNRCTQSADYQHSDQSENLMKNPHKGVHKSYGIHWTDILELNDAEEMAKRSAILIGLICFGFTGAASWMLF